MLELELLLLLTEGDSALPFAAGEVPPLVVVVANREFFVLGLLPDPKTELVIAGRDFEGGERIVPFGEGPTAREMDLRSGVWVGRRDQSLFVPPLELVGEVLFPLEVCVTPLSESKSKRISGGIGVLCTVCTACQSAGGIRSSSDGWGGRQQPGQPGLPFPVLEGGGGGFIVAH